jgi:hypothetical protein
MTLTVYLPWWFRLNCGWHVRCEIIGYEKAFTGIDELTKYFRHQGELVTLWTEKEKLHLKEVRSILDKMIVGAVIAFIPLTFTFDKKRVSRYALINAAVIFSFLSVIPFFQTFWRDIFHALLFDNELWKNNRFDLSYYIMPRQFFKYTVALLTILTCILNLATWFVLSRSRSKV